MIVLVSKFFFNINSVYNNCVHLSLRQLETRISNPKYVTPVCHQNLRATCEL